MDGYVMQHNATTHTESFSMSGLEVVFGERLMGIVASWIFRFESTRLHVGNTERQYSKRNC